MAYLVFARSTAVVFASAIFLAAIPTPAPVHAAPVDLVGTWATVSGDCDQGQHFFGANGECKVWCFDSYSEGQWSLRGGDKVLIKYNSKTYNQEIITVLRIDRYSDHTDLEVRYEDGRREKWTR